MKNDFVMEISVIIPVFKAGEFLRKAVESCLQFESVKEVILVEDGSPDNSLEQCMTLRKVDPRVKLFQHPDKQNHGAGASRNLGLEKAGSAYIAFLDADDYFLPNRFDAEINIFKNIPDADGVYGAIATEYYSEDSKGLIEDFTTISKACPPEELFKGMIGLTKKFGYFSIDALTIKKSALKKMDFFFNPTLRLHQDTDFLIRLSFFTKLYSGDIKNAVAIRGVHANNRITTTYVNRESLNRNKYLLFSHLYEWSKKANVGSEEAAHLGRMYMAAKINVTEKGRWMLFLKSILKDKELIKDPHYYYFYHSSLFKSKKITDFFSKLRHFIYER
jgi:glycosyltransferase involved in cell wall biosynthesis